MNKTAFFSTIIFTLLLAITTFGQNSKTDFSGAWELDMKKSSLHEKSILTSMTMTVKQTNEKIVIKRKTKRDSDSSSSATRTIKFNSKKKEDEAYKLDGSETTTELNNGQAEGTLKLKAQFETNEKLILNKNINLNYGINAINSTTKETWKLSDDGKILEVISEVRTNVNTLVSKMIFTRK